MALIGITFVVFSLAVIVTVKGASLKDKELEEYRIYVQTKQYIEEVAKQKLGLVNPDEILLKPKKKA